MNILSYIDQLPTMPNDHTDPYFAWYSVEMHDIANDEEIEYDIYPRIF